MRELKFRVWDRIGKRFFAPTYKAYKGKLEELLISLDGKLMLRTPNNLVHESVFPNRFISMQYTGFKDKDGKEIYEGDIIEYTSGKWREIVIVKDMVGFARFVGGIETSDNLWEDMEPKIVGNVFENPEIIEKMQKEAEDIMNRILGGLAR